MCMVRGDHTMGLVYIRRISLPAAPLSEGRFSKRESPYYQVVKAGACICLRVLSDPPNYLLRTSLDADRAWSMMGPRFWQDALHRLPLLPEDGLRV